MESKLISVFLILAILLVSGCGIINPQKEQPYFKDVKADPSYLIPSDQNKKSSNLIFTIMNPTTLKFTGIVEARFNDKCLTSYDKEKPVTVKNNDESSSYIKIEVVSQGYPDYKPLEDCYKPQKIILIIESDDKKMVYDSKELEVTIAQ